MPLVFAYGSNLHRAQMRERCPRALALGRAELPGVRLAFAGYSERWGGGVATVELGRGRLHGAIYSVDERELTRLDSFEGAPLCYARMNTDALLCSGDDERIECSVHLYMLVRGADVARAPSRGYLETIERGYEHFRLPVRSLRRAAARARIEARS